MVLFWFACYYPFKSNYRRNKRGNQKTTKDKECNETNHISKTEELP